MTVIIPGDKALGGESEHCSKHRGAGSKSSVPEPPFSC
jgi:hypothetical protein